MNQSIQMNGCSAPDSGMSTLFGRFIKTVHSFLYPQFDYSQFDLVKQSVRDLVRELDSDVLFEYEQANQSQNTGDFSLAVCEIDGVKVSISHLSKTAVIPLHDHPQGSALNIVLKGAIQIHRYASQSTQNHGIISLQPIDSNILHSGEFSTIDVVENYHQLEGLKQPNLILNFHLSNIQGTNAHYVLPVEYHGMHKPFTGRLIERNRLQDLQLLAQNKMNINDMEVIR